MNPEMLDHGRRLENEVLTMLELLAGIQTDLAAIPDCPPATEAAEKLTHRRATLDNLVALMEQGQAELDQQMQQYTSALASREAALERSQAKLRALTRRLVQVQEDERRALARDLHDTSGQAITVIGLGLSVLRREGGCSPTMRSRIEDLQRTVTGVAEDLHRLAVNLRPSSLDRYGLAPAAEELVAALRTQAGIEVDFRVEGLDERLPGDVETALYRIVQEACTNIARYAQASRASVYIRRNGAGVQVRVADDGSGFDVAEALGRGRLGLVGMTERAEMLGGTCSIDSSPGQGATVHVNLPLAPAAGVEVAGDDAGDRVVAPEDAAASSETSELARIKVLSDALGEITAGMAQFERAGDMLAFVLTHAAAAVGCDYAIVASRVGGRWTVNHGYGLPESMIGQRLAPSAVPLAKEIERTRGVVVVNDPSADDPLAVATRETGAFSGAGFPLIAAGRFLGAVAFVHNTAPVPFRPSEVRFLQHLTSVISLVLEIIHLRGQG